MTRSILCLFSFLSFVTLAGTNIVGTVETRENAEQEHKRLSNGGVLVTRSQTAEYYRSGMSGELGYGYAYVVNAGDGHARFGAYVPRSRFVVLFEAQGYDPLLSYYGTQYSSETDFTQTLNSLDYDVYDTPGLYNRTVTTYVPTNSFPVSVDVINSYGTTALQSFSVSASYLYLYVDGTDHYLYDFSSDPYAMTVTYTDAYYDYVSWEYMEVQRTIHINFQAATESGYDFAVFGDRGAYSTPTDVDTRVGSYIQSHPIQRTVLKERTGKEYELGDGWGYMVYDWTSDMRSWQIKIPSLVPASSYTATRSTLSYGFTYPSNPMIDIGFACGAIIERVKSTHEKYSTDCVRTANAYIQGWGFPSGSGAVDTPVVRIDVDNLVYGSSGYNSTCTLDPCVTNWVFTFDWGVKNTAYTTRSNAYHCVMSNFRATNNGLTYDNAVHWTTYNNGVYMGEGGTTNYPVCGFTLTRNVNAFRTVTTPVVKIATAATAHYYWDPGLKCTWEMSVTNGCFFAEKISTTDLTTKD